MKLLIAATLLSVVSFVAAECPNACSGHGQCSRFDMCTCFRNWDASDCSQRSCPFDLAHVDTPKGDLNMDNAITSGTVISGSTTYPLGTTEMYPNMVDSAGNTLTDTAHSYMECSNKGLCDRETGVCDCFDGYDGAACNRASCPNDCSGHGSCQSVSDLANGEFGNVYTLWDKDASMGCKCDAGYFDSDCSQRTCKKGVDPLYSDDTTVRVAKFTYKIEGTASKFGGTYAIKFYDVDGEDYQTGPIDAGTTFDGGSGSTSACLDVLAAFTALPDAVTRTAPTCTVTALTVGNTGYTVSLEFRGQPGYLKPIEIITFLDGKISTLIQDIHDYGGTDLSIVYMVPQVVTDRNGEFTDNFTSKCVGVQVTILADQNTPNSNVAWASAATPASSAVVTINAGRYSSTTASGELNREGPLQGSLGYVSASTAHMSLLKACLGDSDGDITNNVDVYNWDHGALISEHSRIEDNSGTPAGDSANPIPTTKVVMHEMNSFPHAIKTVPVGGSDFDVGEYHIVWWDSTRTSGKEMRVANLAADSTTNFLYSHASATMYDVHTTSGIVRQLGRNLRSMMIIQTTAVNTGNIGKPSFFSTSGPELDAFLDKEFTTLRNETKLTGYFDKGSNEVYTSWDASCETYSDTTGDTQDIHECVEKGDMLFIIDSCWGAGGGPTNHPISGVMRDAAFGGNVINPTCVGDATSPNTGTGNLYKVNRIYTKAHTANTIAFNYQVNPGGNSDGSVDAAFNTRLEDRFVIEVDQRINWDGSATGNPDNNYDLDIDDNSVSTYTDIAGATQHENHAIDNIGTTGLVVLFKFTPATDGSAYTYVSECSNRGACDRASGLCDCFKGYTADDCSVQNALAI